MLATPPSGTAPNRAAFGTQPVVQLRDGRSNAAAISGVPVTAAISSGGGALGGTTTVPTDVSGKATFTDLSIAGGVGTRTVTFSAPGLLPVGAQITTTAGAPAVLSMNAGDNQAAAPSAAVSVSPSVRVHDADVNPVPGVNVTFAVVTGGGSVTGATAATDASGVATVGAWTLGPSLGTNSLSASVTGVASGVSFTALATDAVVVVSSVSPATLTSGTTATITGSGFHPTAASNAVTIDGVTATVTGGSATSLTVTVPQLPCTPPHTGVVSVTASGITGQKTHAMQPALSHTLARGESVILNTAAKAACNELHNAGGPALYYVTIFNTNTAFSVTGAGFELRGSTATPSLIASPPATSIVRRPAKPPAETPEALAQRAHLEHLERELKDLREHGRSWRQGLTARLDHTPAVAHAVGDAVTFKIGDIDSNNSCNTFFTRTGRVAYVGTKSIIIEDNENALAGTIDSTYQQIGTEYDNVMAPILEANYGNPIATDALLDNNQRIVMVFSKKVGEMSNGNLAGFVTGRDMRSTTQCASSNVGEFFYAVAPTLAGDINTAGSPPRWRWTIRSTVIHEVKHIVSVAERFSRNGGTAFEVSWLEESTARLSEELFERTRYSFAQRANIGYGSAANLVGPYCGVRSGCGQPRGIVRVWEELDGTFYLNPQDHSPLGRINANDFSFYAVGWSLVRWALDASPTNEATLIKALTQEPFKVGVLNFESVFGSTFAEIQPKWIMAMILDDYPAFTPADATLRQPSWNFRDIYRGLNDDFGGISVDWPFVPMQRPFGTFSTSGTIRPGTAAIVEISGAQAEKQLIELKANGIVAAAPAELRLAIVRVQ